MIDREKPKRKKLYDGLNALAMSSLSELPTPPKSYSKLELINGFFKGFHCVYVNQFSIRSLNQSNRKLFRVSNEYLHGDNPPDFVLEIDRLMHPERNIDADLDETKRKIDRLRQDAMTWFKAGQWSVLQESGKRPKPARLAAVWMEVIEVIIRKEISPKVAASIVAERHGKSSSTVYTNYRSADNWIKQNNPPFYRHAQMHLGGIAYANEVLRPMRRVMETVSSDDEQIDRTRRKVLDKGNERIRKRLNALMEDAEPVQFDFTKLDGLGFTSVKELRERLGDVEAYYWLNRAIS